MYTRKNQDMPIVQIIGSLRYIDGMKEKAWELTCQGNLVWLPNERPENMKDPDIELLEEIGFAKIDLADKIFVYNKDGYIGESTSKEIEYAEFNNKDIEYLEDKRKLTIILGKTCSGKDSIVNELIKRGYKKIVTNTTRPMRNGEIQGKTYNFMKREDFIDAVGEGKFAEYTCYNVASGETWYYGTTKDSLKVGKIVILNPAGFKNVREKINIPYRAIYLYANDDIIRERLIQRGDNPEEAERRLLADKNDFEPIEPLVDYIIMNNGQKTIEQLANNVIDIIEGRFI